MSIKIDISSNLAEVGLRLNNLKRTTLRKSTVWALKKSFPTLEKEAVGQVQRLRRLTAKHIKHRWFKRVTNYKAKDFSRIGAELWVKSRPISTIHLVRGAKRPRDQKGKPAGRSMTYPRRGRIKVEAERGKVSKPRGYFIARGKSGNVHVFSRIPGSKTKPGEFGRSNPKIWAPPAPSIHYLLDKSTIQARIRAKLGPFFSKRMVEALRFYEKR